MPVVAPPSHPQGPGGGEHGHACGGPTQPLSMVEGSPGTGWQGLRSKGEPPLSWHKRKPMQGQQAYDKHFFYETFPGISHKDGHPFPFQLRRGILQLTLLGQIASRLEATALPDFQVGKVRGPEFPYHNLTHERERERKEGDSPPSLSPPPPCTYLLYIYNMYGYNK